MSFSTAGRILSFADEFSQLSFNDGSTGTWTTHFPFDGGGGSDRFLAVSHESQIYVDPTYAGTGSAALGLNPFATSNGVLSITAAPTPAALQPLLYNQPYTSGLLTTDGTFAQQYGYFEMRAQLPAGQGLWPGFWLLPQAVGTPGEIDIMEVLGQQPTVLYLSTHGALEFRGIDANAPDLSAGFHTFGLNWTASSLTWYLDGTAVASVATPSDLNQPMYLLADLAVGGPGSWPGPPDATTPFPATLQIDYIHAYADPTHVIAPPALPASGSSVAWMHATAPGQTLIATDVNTRLSTAYATTTLVGGGGDNVFVINNDSDVVVDQAGGTDTVLTWTHRYALPDGVENLTLAAGTGAIGIGNGANNIIVGTAANDTVVAGTATSVLSGGTGSDLFVLDHAGPTTITDFTTGAGGDVLKFDAPQFHSFNDVRAAMSEIGPDVTLTLGSHQVVLDNAALGSLTPANVELPLWLPASHTPSVYLNAGAAGQTLTATQANSQLATSYGTVTLVGGPGDTTYLVANPTDVVVQHAGGVNTIESWAHAYTLPANVQNLTIAQGGGATATGNALDNVLTGGAGNDSLAGVAGNNILIGGGGSDTMSGGPGNNLFVFGPADHDAVITDFAIGRDHLDLRAVVAGLSPSHSPVEADHVILKAAGTGTAITIDPELPGVQPHTLVQLQGVAPGALHPETDFFL